MSDEITERVRQIVAEILEVEVEEVPPEADLVGDLGADSMSGLELMATLERSFEIVIPPEDMTQLQSVAAAATLVRRIRGEES